MGLLDTLFKLFVNLTVGVLIGWAIYTKLCAMREKRILKQLHRYAQRRYPSLYRHVGDEAEDVAGEAWNNWKETVKDE